MRTKFICIIWTKTIKEIADECSWGLSLFVLFELCTLYFEGVYCSWGLSLFVLFELFGVYNTMELGSWGLSLFVLFEH